MAIKLLGPDGLPIDREPINNNWYHWAGQWSNFIINPDLIPITEYERMEETDETVFSGLEFLKQAVLSRIGEYEHPDEDIEQFVRVQLENITGSFKAVCSDILTAVQYGFSLGEILWCKDGDKIGLRGVQGLHPATITMDLYKEGELKNQVSAFWQFQFCANKALIPSSKVIHFSHRGSFGNPYGKSRLKRAYKSWFIKDVLLRAWGTTQERYGTPIAISTGPLMGEVNYKGTMTPVPEYMGAMLDSIGTNGSLVCPSGQVVKIEYAPSGLGRDFNEAIRYCNRSIHQAIGLPSLIADSGTTGSYSLGKEHSDTFERLLENLLDDLIEVILEQLIRPLIEYNFGPQDTFGDFSVELFDPTHSLAVAQTTAQLITSQVVSVDRLGDLNKLRALNNFPPLEQEDLSATYPAMQATDILPSAPVAPAKMARFSRATSLCGKRAQRLARQMERSQAHPDLARVLRLTE